MISWRPPLSPLQGQQPENRPAQRCRPLRGRRGLVQVVRLRDALRRGLGDVSAKMGHWGGAPQNPVGMD